MKHNSVRQLIVRTGQTKSILIVAPTAFWAMIGLILEIHALEEQMRALATYDDLTGLLNKRAFLEQALYRAKEKGRNQSALF